MISAFFCDWCDKEFINIFDVNKHGVCPHEVLDQSL